MKSAQITMTLVKKGNLTSARDLRDDFESLQETHGLEYDDLYIDISKSKLIVVLHYALMPERAANDFSWVMEYVDEAEYGQVKLTLEYYI